MMMAARIPRVLLVLGLTMLALTPLAARPVTTQAQQGPLARLFHAVTAGGVSLESLPLLNGSRGSSEKANAIPPGNSANSNGKTISHGLQFYNGNYGDPAHAAFRLRGHYTRLSGTVYADDSMASDSWKSTPTISIYDISGADPATADSTTIQHGRVIYSYTFAQNKGQDTFVADIHGAKAIGIVLDSPRPGVAAVDLVAVLSTGASVTVFSPPLTLLPSANETIGGTALPFTWKAVPQATFYYLQIWLTRLAAGQSIGPRSVVTFAARVMKTSYQLDTTLYPKGVYHWRMAASTGTSISGWTTENTVTLQ